jgi:cytochrome P450
VSGWAAEITVAELDDDPYPIYARLREESPVAWVPAVGMWLATSWDAALRVASEPETFAADMPGSPIDRSFGSPTILTCDGEPHRDLRKAIDPKYRPAEVEGYIEDLVGPIVERQLAALDPAGEVDLMPEFFEPVSVISLGAVLGLDEVDADTLRRWFAALADGATNFEQDPEKQAHSDAASAEIDERLTPLLERLERKPDESAISHMIHAGRPDGSPRSRTEYMPSLKVILLGGMQEPGHGAGSVLYALLIHPEAMAEVVGDAETMLPAAIEEGMRWVAPIGTQGRRVVSETDLEGVSLEAGAPIAGVISSANRDAARFPDPDRFDLHRERQRTATFGFGRHFCSGHAFARAQERIALRELLAAYPDATLAAEPEFSGWEFRAPRDLRVRLK